MTTRWIMTSGTSGGSFRLVINTNRYNPNFRTLALAAGWNGTDKVDVIINAGVEIANLSITDLPNDKFTIINSGRIGGGSVARTTGMFVRNRVSIVNNGVIFGPGGTGGTGEGISLCWSSSCHDAPGGAGGIGAGYVTYDGWNTFSFINAQTGGGQIYSDRPSTGIPGDNGSWLLSGAGGTGGTLGNAGQSGGFSQNGGSYTTINVTPSTSGTPAGNCVDGNSYITWLVTGTRSGNII